MSPRPARRPVCNLQAVFEGVGHKLKHAVGVGGVGAGAGEHLQGVGRLLGLSQLSVIARWRSLDIGCSKKPPAGLSQRGLRGLQALQRRRCRRRHRRHIIIIIIMALMWINSERTFGGVNGNRRG